MDDGRKNFRHHNQINIEYLRSTVVLPGKDWRLCVCVSSVVSIFYVFWFSSVCLVWCKQSTVQVTWDQHGDDRRRVQFSHSQVRRPCWQWCKVNMSSNLIDNRMHLCIIFCMTPWTARISLSLVKVIHTMPLLFIVFLCKQVSYYLSCRGKSPQGQIPLTVSLFERP